MGWRRQQSNKNKKKNKKKFRSSKEVYDSVRKPCSPPGKVHKSKKDYDRHDKEWLPEDI